MAPPLTGSVAPAVQCHWSEATLPAVCSVVESAGLVLSYQPRLEKLPFSKPSENNNVPLPGGGGGGAAVTVTDAVPVLPDDVAVIVAVPAATPVTTPLLFTVAAMALLVVHVIICPVIVAPF